MFSLPSVVRIGTLVLVLLAIGVLLTRCLGQQERQNHVARKLVIIGIDSADRELLKPMVEGSRLPNLKLFMEEAAYGKMRTNVPPQQSPLLWASICTGMGPLVHGVSHSARGPQKGLVQDSFWGAPALWDIIGAADMITAAMGLWTTHPARPIPGVMVSDNLPYDLEQEQPLTNIVYPDSLTEALLALRVDPESLGAEALARFIPADRIADFMKRFPQQISILQEAWAADLTYYAVARYLAGLADFDLFFFYLRGPNMVNQDFFNYLVLKRGSNVLQQGDVEVFASVVPLYYEWVDEVLGDVLRWFPHNRQAVLLWDRGISGKLEDQPKEPIEPCEFGVFMVRSPLYLPGYEFEEVGLMDICPTILGLMGLPPAQDMPGEIHLSGVAPQGGKRFMGLEKNRIPTYMPLLPLEEPEEEKNLLVDEEMSKQLQSLGYTQ